MEYNVIIPSAGVGKRMGANQNKLFLNIKEEAVIVHTVRVFADDALCSKIILPINHDEKETFVEKFCASNISLEKIVFTEGGIERQHSVKNGIEAISNNAQIVLVHDGARPFVTRDHIAELVDSASKHGGSVLAVRVKDTIKRVRNYLVEETVDRDRLWSIQTPQAFRVEILQKAHREAHETNYLGTDEASLVERIGEQVHITEGSYENIKLTTQEDILFAEAIINRRSCNV